MSSSNVLNILNNFPPYPGDDVSGWTGANFIVSRGYWETYEWLVVIGAIFAFAMAWSIGANDVANAFGTTVGSKTITLWQACIIAAAFEFTGAMALGGTVTKTVAGGITNPAFFQQVPEVFAFGMMCAVGTAATIVTVATYFSAAVSTTHSIIGAIIGFGLIYGGGPAIIWAEKIDEFPYQKGVVTIFISWFVSPILAGIISSIIFLLNRTCILRRKNSTNLAFWSLPILAWFTVFINLLFVLMKGAGKELQWEESKAAWVSAVSALGAAFLCIPAVFLLKKKHAATTAKLEAEAAEAANPEAGKKQMDEESDTIATPPEPRSGPLGIYDKVKNQIIFGLTMDIHADTKMDVHVEAMHAAAEVFNPQTEEVYKYLQVFSACCVSFAHGANDTANAIGPFAAIWYVYRNWTVASSAETPKWILAMGGAGIVIGLATYGYNIMRVLGVQMAKMTPSRGFAAELATSLTIAIATIYGLPVSSTQTIVGAEVGVGLSENIRGTGVNFRLFAKTAFGWVLAFTSAGLVSAAFFAFCIFSPSLNDLDYVANWQNAMTSVMKTELTALNQTSNFVGDKALNATLVGLAKNLTSMNDFKKYGKTDMYDMMAVFKNVTQLYVNWTLPMLNSGAPAV